jgi:integrase
VLEDRVRHELMRLTRRIGVAGSTALTVLRHQFATWLQERNIAPLIPNLLMGHASARDRSAGQGLRMTAVYTHTRPETIRGQLASALAGRVA